MIEYLHGKIIEKEIGHIIIDVGGIGFGLIVSDATLKDIPEVGEETSLFTHLHFTENDQTLIGFSTKMEKEIFEILISTSGIGPKMSIAILSAMPIDKFAEAIIAKRTDILTEIPGVGKKTAERLIIELKDKVQKFFKKAKIDIPQSDDFRGSDSPVINDAISALINLGIKPQAAASAIRKAFNRLGETASTEELIKEGLKFR